MKKQWKSVDSFYGPWFNYCFLLLVPFDLQFHILSTDLLWVLSRKKELPVMSRVQVYDILSTLNIDSSRLTLTKHTKCPKF